LGDVPAATEPTLVSAPHDALVDPSPVPRGNFGLFVGKGGAETALFDDVVVTIP
jgi:hypothetical protein